MTRGAAFPVPVYFGIAHYFFFILNLAKVQFGSSASSIYSLPVLQTEFNKLGGGVGCSHRELNDGRSILVEARSVKEEIKL